MEAPEKTPSLQIDAFILRTLEIEPDISFDDLAKRIFYSYGYYLNDDDIQERVDVYYYHDGTCDHISLN